MQNENKPSASAAPIKLSEKVGYGMGDTASNFFFHSFNIILLNYYVQDLGISAAAIGVMFMVTKIFDAVTDPIMGIIADRTNTKWGHFRPLHLMVRNSIRTDWLVDVLQTPISRKVENSFTPISLTQQ